MQEKHEEFNSDFFDAGINICYETHIYYLQNNLFFLQLTQLYYTQSWNIYLKNGKKATKLELHVCLEAILKWP